MQNLSKSVLQRLQETRPGAGSHPDADLLAAFAEHSLAGRERSFVLEHLAACSDCREAIVLALPETATETGSFAVPSAGGARGGWLTWPALRWTALAAGILAVASVGILQYSHRNRDKSIASNFMLREAAPAPSNQPPSGKVAAPEEDTQQEPLTAPRSQMLPAHEPAAKANGGAQSRRGAASAAEIGGMAPRALPPPTHREWVAMDQNQLTQNRPDLPLQDRTVGNSDVVKAKDPVPAQTAPISSAASAPPGMPLQTSPPLMLRVSPRWTIGPAGALRRSFDGGTTWETVNPNMSIASPTDQAGGGPDQQKKEAASDFHPIFRAVAARGLEVWAGTLAGTLYHTSDGGSRWARVVPSEAGMTITGDIMAIQFSDPQQGKVSTSTGELWSTFDGGQTWHKQP